MGGSSFIEDAQKLRLFFFGVPLKQPNQGDRASNNRHARMSKTYCCGFPSDTKGQKVETYTKMVGFPLTMLKGIPE